MTPEKALNNAIEKAFHKWCMDTGCTKEQIKGYDRAFVKQRLIIAKKLQKAGFKQNLIARVMNRGKQHICTILKGSKNEKDI